MPIPTKKNQAKDQVYLAFGLFVLGLGFFGYLVVNHGQPQQDKAIASEEKDSMNASSIMALRLKAMAEARQSGKHEYSFTAGKAPPPISP